ncbi:hypothetical protein PILCRDRAFT_818188 [Piloderma croceum F 1598]|uniref:Uncharacterized protein n=1 Tax=Piloderma croceum (strain F 1598) TaxID=765440 RepID=A0A0C3FY72_PILCF|nr:hypothetical protein PILCRDRAFT_818188 [Piloderma croceum F 1598]
MEVRTEWIMRRNQIQKARHEVKKGLLRLDRLDRTESSIAKGSKSHVKAQHQLVRFWGLGGHVEIKASLKCHL